ncbi:MULTISPECIES: aldo/keto reductase [unclassified Modicisalibacter]|uniref:aldo/keto reductase n=1 Tax=unclassified Modicisalibacter TaxID=2679913 RepID=UPI001CC96881|nr:MULTISPECIES: aldo/keto reductase [unclassified Modicisalibacter]MBZ9559820.1 aldo/keto reductase [Modicisalibacter sp. R2A 31.J]MBZ9577272.1 aldo/keto reductase [Modicisalibacter sp. MOD 31.J]
MDYRRLGTTGLKVSPLCLGTMTYGTPQWRDWVLDDAQSRPFIERALEAGINFFDTADMYSDGESERVVGRALRDFARREAVVVATKVYNPTGDKGPNERGLSKKHIRHAIDASLERLGMDYVDLYQTHRWDYDTPIEETMESLHEVVCSGKALYLGASSMHAWQFAKAQRVARENGWTPFSTMQPMVNLIYREEEREMIPQCIDQGVGVIPWSPLARGILAGSKPVGGEGETTRARSDEQMRNWKLGLERDRPVIEALQALATEKGVSPAQVALAWLLHKPGITAPIVGASKSHHLDQALGALDVSLAADEIERLEAPYVPHEVVGFV